MAGFNKPPFCQFWSCQFWQFLELPILATSGADFGNFWSCQFWNAVSTSISLTSISQTFQIRNVLSFTYIEVCEIIDCGFEFPFLARNVCINFANFGMFMLLPILGNFRYSGTCLEICYVHDQFFPTMLFD